MKHYKLIIIFIFVISFTSSCIKNALDQIPTTELSTAVFFQNIDDATYALNGVYNATRLFFHKNYAWDGGTEMMHARVSIPYGNYNPSANMGSAFGTHWSNGYTVINRANYVLENIRKMYATQTGPAAVTALKRIEGELLFMRAITYFRLIDLWGDVPYFTNVLEGNTQAYQLTRTPRSVIKDSMIADLTIAADYIPVSIPDAERGRATRVAVYGYRGKIKLYWACWAKKENKPAEAEEYYRAAAADFAEVMKPVYGRTLYKGGDPGTADAPNYGEIFDGKNEYNSEVIFSVSNGGPGFGNAGAAAVNFGDTYIYDFGTRSTGAGGCNVTPTIRLMDRYQQLATGGFAPKLIPSNNKTLPNGAVNPQSYAGRDYRMKASIMWDGETMLRISADGMTIGPDKMTFEFKKNDNVTFIFADGCFTGYIYRKFVRQFAFGPREDGPQDLYLMRLPDVWLMFAEAVNEFNNGPTAEAYALIDQIRRRGNLPPLNRSAFATRETFFRAIEQERIVELVAEGHRFFDIRRWFQVEEIWPSPAGQTLFSTWNESGFSGRSNTDEFKNATERDYQRFYKFQIPPAEIILNPGLTQNEPWL